MNKHIGYRPTWAEIDLGNLAHNFKQIKRSLSSETKIMVCVKADAYGHGLIPVVKKLVELGVDYFGVASIDEGILLRNEKVGVPILILGMVLKGDIAPLFKYNLFPTVCTKELALALNNKALKDKKRLPVHIKVDTGMGRIGVLPYDALHFVKMVHGLKGLTIEGLFTHFAFADMDKEFTLRQLEQFSRLSQELSKEGIGIPILHAANSMAVADYKGSHFNMVRPGLIVYGLKPAKEMKLKLKPVLSLKTRIVYLKRMPALHGISYGRTYITNRETTVITLPIGYGDGYPRNLSNIAPVIIRGKLFKVSGRVCMDQTMVDVGDLPVKIGDEVVLIGRQGSSSISAEELAALSGTISYEIVCGLGSRVPRVYID
ncbi:MAG: alanine racemase [Candidatus Omnitrophica bacterium]|nr:alanine racemase [Candidatus Omnitrophota bacterium]